MILSESNKCLTQAVFCTKLKNMNKVKNLFATIPMFLIVVAPLTGTQTTVDPTYHTPVVTCTPRPACLDAKPSCMIAEPMGGWCTPITGNPTCTPRPACLDAKPPCKIIIPNMCPQETPIPTPEPIRCGGFIKNAPTCPNGFTCKLSKIADTGGICVPVVIPTAAATTSQYVSFGTHQNIFATIWGFILHLFRR